MEDGLDLKYYIVLLRRRWLILASAFVFVFGAFAAFAILLPPVYRSEAKILVEAQQIPADLVRSTVTSLADERLQVIKQRVTARDALLGIADKFRLLADDRGKLSPTELVDLLRERVSIEPFNLGATGRRDRPRARDGAFTIAFTVGFEDRHADVAARVANELVTLILNEDVRARTSSTSETTQFLSREVERLQKSLDDLSGKLGEARLGEKLEQDQQAERFEVIEQPVTPTDPVKPDRRKIVALGSAFAVAAAIGAVLGLESLDKSIRSSHDVTRALGRPPLVAIPYLRTQHERRKQREQFTYGATAAAVICLLGLILIHVLIMPLDIVAMKVMHRLEI